MTALPSPLLFLKQGHNILCQYLKAKKENAMDSQKDSEDMAEELELRQRPYSFFHVSRVRQHILLKILKCFWGHKHKTRL